MQLFSPAVNRVLTAVLVVGALVLTGLAFRRPRPVAQPLEGAQLAGMRSIFLEDAQPMPRFDDQRPPIVVAPPAEGRWTAWVVGLGSRRQVALTVEPIDDVVRVRVQAPLPEGRWDLVLADDRRLKTWPVRFTTPPVESDAIAVLKRRAKAEAIDARPALWTDALTNLTPTDQVAAHVEAARAWIRAGRLDAAGTQYEAAAAIAGELGWVSEQAARLRAAAWTLYRQRRFGEALAALQRAASFGADAESAARLAYLRGCVQRETGDFRNATASLRAALDSARSVGDARFQDICTDELATLLSDLGQHTQALTLLTKTPTDGPARGRRLTSRGWIAARLAEWDPTLIPTARSALQEALEFLENPDVLHSAKLNLVELELREENLSAVQELLSEIDTDTAPFARSDGRLIRGAVALKRGDFGAASALFTMVAESPFSSLEQKGRAHGGLVELAASKEDLESGKKHAKLAFKLLERLARRAAVSAERASWLADRSHLITVISQLYLKTERADQALATLDQGRAWVIRDLEARLRVERLNDSARQLWLQAQGKYLKARETFEAAITTCQRRPTDERAACEARLRTQRATVEQRFDDLYAVLDQHAPSALSDVKLPTLPAGQALFTATTLEDRTVGFWLTGETVVARTIDPAQPLAQFAAEIQQVDHLYVVAGGGLTPANVLADPRATARPHLTWSEVPFAGLLTRPTTPATAPPVVIADPALDLQHAAQEGAAVHSKVGGRLLQGDAAHREAVTEALQSGARLLHFAGHGALDAESPWQAHLVLADEARLTLADLLVAAPRVGLVVLSGCQTGVRQALSRQHAVGLTDAFLLAGAHAVIATDRVIPDDQARAFIDLFYQSPDWARRPAAAYAAAIRALRAAGNPIWSAFRYLGRA